MVDRMRSTDTSLDSKLARGRHRIWPSRQLSNLWQLGILEFSRFLFRHQRLHGLFLELYSSCHHILAVHKKDYSLVHAMGLLFETDTAGFLRLNKTTQARTDYIGNLHAAHPWFSPVDVRLLLESWDADANSLFTFMTMTKKTVKRVHQFSPLRRNLKDSMRLTVIQQSTKCDRQAPLPLRG